MRSKILMDNFRLKDTVEQAIGKAFNLFIIMFYIGSCELRTTNSSLNSNYYFRIDLDDDYLRKIYIQAKSLKFCTVY